MKPIIKYRGGKSKELSHLLRQIPVFNGRYVEPFLGGGALFFHLEPRQSIINDINEKLIQFYRGVRDDFVKVRAELDELNKIYANNRKLFEALKNANPNNRVEDANELLYYRLRDMFNGLTPKQYSDASLYYFINKTSYSGMIRYNSKGEFNVPYGRYKSISTDIVTIAHSELLKSAEIYNTDYSEIFAMLTPEDFVFLDPPYDCAFSDYGNEEYKGGFNEDSHRRLANDFRHLQCPALLVIGKTPLTEELYGDLIVDEYDKSYSVNIKNRFKAGAKHILVRNF